MQSPIVHAPTVLTLLGGGSVTSEELAIARKIAPILVALDGGAEMALLHCTKSTNKTPQISRKRSPALTPP
jgi:hypothetical protein